MANCLGLGRASNATTNGTIGSGSGPSNQPQQVNAAGKVEMSAVGAMMLFVGAVGWVGLNL
jgi:hypothetical protein